VIDLSDATGELPHLRTQKLEVTGLMKQPDFAIDAEAATMSEVGTKLDLARAYIDMGDPEGARSILDEVLKEGNPNQRKEAERLLAGCLSGGRGPRCRGSRSASEYDGSAYAGWQHQAHARGVQGELERALAEVAGHEVASPQPAARMPACMH